MRYIDYKDGGPELLTIATKPTPEPKPDELLIRVQAAGVNRPDIVQRKGLYPPPPGASPILGLEVAGEVEAIGANVTIYKKGDRVCALTNGGGYAEFVVAPATQCLPWPIGYDAIRAAALPENMFTVWSNLFMRPTVRAGETLLVHGGSSGIGLTALHLAHALGIKTFTTAGNAEKCAACERAGAIAINYKTEDFEKRIAELTDNKGVDAILDMVGAAYLPRNLNCLAHDGRLVQIAVQTGSKAELNLSQMMTRRLILTGSTLRPRSATEKAAIAQSLLEHVWPILAQGQAAPTIHEVFPFEEVAQAHALMESSQHIGKIILRLAA